VICASNDKIAAKDVLAAEPERSCCRRPCTPNEAGICLDLIEQASPNIPDPRRLPWPSGHRPAFGGEVVARAGAGARQAFRMRHQGEGVFRASTARSRRRAIIRWWSSAALCRERSALPPKPTTA